MNKKEYQNNWKKEQIINNTDYAKRQRIYKNSDDFKNRRKELRLRKEAKEKQMLYQREYRQKPEVKIKNKARQAVRFALEKNILKRPDQCEICNKKDIPLTDGRSSLRADHYLGYETINYLKVIFICVECDGKQLRKYGA